MEEKFDSNVIKLEQEIFDISKNINKFKNKNHKTMLNIMEKIKSFSNDIKYKNAPLIPSNKKIEFENKKKSLMKTYHSQSNNNISPTSPSNNTYHFEKSNNFKKPRILKENNIYNNLGNETETIILYSNRFHNAKNEKYLSNISYNSSMNENNKNNHGRNTGKAHMNKCFSFNF